MRNIFCELVQQLEADTGLAGNELRERIGDLLHVLADEIIAAEPYATLTVERLRETATTLVEEMAECA